MSARNRAILTAIGVLLISGVMCHLLSADSYQLDAASSRVEHVPLTVGDWHGHEEQTDADAFAKTGAKTYWTRTYVNQRTKDSVLAILMCGRPGKMSVHTPEVCYRGAGFELQGNPAVCPLSSEPGEMWSAHFMKKSTVATHLRLYWAWNSRGVWEASAAPRWEFRGEPFLYKLYVSRDLGRQPNRTPQTDPTVEFLREFAPALQQTLFPS